MCSWKTDVRQIFFLEFPISIVLNLKSSDVLMYYLSFFIVGGIVTWFFFVRFILFSESTVLILFSFLFFKMVSRDWAHGRMRVLGVCLVQGPVVWQRELSLSFVPFFCSPLHLCCKSMCWSFTAVHSLCTWVRQGKLWRLKRAQRNMMKALCAQAVLSSLTCVGVRKL